MLTLALMFALQAPIESFDARSEWMEEPVPQQECKSAYGVTRCGYGCTAAYGLVRCASHPAASCKAAYGTIECGFGCVAAYGRVQCAQHPGGVCHAAYGAVTCSEPPAIAHRPRRRGWQRAVPQQECKSAYGVTACGYGCAAAYGQVKCASRPGGICHAAYGTIACSE